MNLHARTIIFFVSVLIIDFLAGEKIDFNPYEVLDVDRSATPAEIRSIYKKLAREWHPDKNKSPGAQDKFIKIQQAYEILSDENKRDQYDTGGYSGDSMGQWRPFGEPLNFRYSDFDFFSNHGSIRTLSVHDYYGRVLPESHQTPQLIYVYSTFCAQCVIWLRTSWQKAAKDLEGLGVAVYAVDTTFTSRIASSLGVSRVPTIVGMYKEQTYYFKGQISKEELKFFVKSFLPSDIIMQVTSENAQEFLGGIESDDKPRAVLFSDKQSPTLLYHLMSLKYQKYFKFGFVNLKDSKASSVVKNFAVSQYGPTLLVFKDNLGKPSVVLGASEMPHGAINEILSANKFVAVPRLTSQEVFDEVCGAPHGAVHSVRLCMILVSDPSYKYHDTISTNLKKLVEEAESKEDSLNEWLKFMRVYTSKQPAFTRSLLPTEVDQPKLLLLWRRGRQMSSVKHLDVDFLRHPLASAKQEFQVCLRTSLEAAHLQRFESTVTLEPLVDELAPFVLLRILQKFVSAIEYISSFSERQGMAMLMVTAFFILMFGSLFGSSAEDGTRQGTPHGNRTERMTTQESAEDSTEEESDIGEEVEVEIASEPPESSPQMNASTSSNSRESSPQVSPGNLISPATVMQELVSSTYETSVLNQSRGHVTVILLLDNDAENKEFLIEEYQQVMKVFIRDPKITITYLNVAKYTSWYHELRRTSTAEPPDDKGQSGDMSSLHGSYGDFGNVGHEDRVPESPAQACGTVLALNGARHWYCIFVPRAVKLEHEKEPTPEEDESRNSAEEDTYAEALSCWMDRVREGQMPRLYVRQWPGLYVHSRDDEEEDDDDDF